MIFHGNIHILKIKKDICRQMNSKQKLVVIGGGAAGFFAAITAAENNPDLAIIILEQGNEVLGKVKISGGGRCNVTHACFDVKELVKFYPRGSKELVGPFYTFNCEHTVDWFNHHQVALKTESDGRMFPVSNRSQTIIDCFIKQCHVLNIEIIKQAKVTHIEKQDTYKVFFNDKCINADYILLASGSSNTIWNMLKKLGHQIISPVPSLFTFTIKNELIKNLEGVSVSNVHCKLLDSNIATSGSILITHTGLSGSSILKLSAFAAREMNARNYQFYIEINWISIRLQDAIQVLKNAKQTFPKKNISNLAVFDLPHRLWQSVLAINGIKYEKNVADLSNNDIQNIAQTLTQSKLQVTSKNTNKDEFVTAGGIDLKEVDFKTMESKVLDNLFFAGEVLNIDAVTGGFNFQAAWTTGNIAGTSIAERSTNYK